MYIYIYIYIHITFTGKFVYMAHHFILLWLHPVAVMLIERDAGLSTLCHSCGSACQRFLALAISTPDQMLPDVVQTILLGFIFFCAMLSQEY